MLPIPGTSSVAHLEDNLKAAAIELSDAQFEALMQLPRTGELDGAACGRRPLRVPSGERGAGRRRRLDGPAPSGERGPGEDPGEEALGLGLLWAR